MGTRLSVATQCLLAALAGLAGCNRQAGAAAAFPAIPSTEHHPSGSDPMPALHPVCAGRFTLHLPAAAQGGFSQSEFNSMRLAVATLPAGTGMDAAWQQHVGKLRTELGDQNSARVVKVYTLSNRPAVFYRYSPAGDSPYTLETWTDLHPAVLETEFDGDRADLPAIERLVTGVLTHFAPDGSGTPVADAFCVSGGAIHLPPDQGEQVAGSWHWDGGYQVQFRSAVVSKAGTVSTAETARKDAAAAAGTPGAHVRLLRAGERTVLGMAGQESVVTYHNDPSPTEFYEATFQFGGVADRGSRPGMTLKLTARDQPGSKVDATHFSNTWNSLLDSLQVRLRD